MENLSYFILYFVLLKFEKLFRSTNSYSLFTKKFVTHLQIITNT